MVIGVPHIRYMQNNTLKSIKYTTKSLAVYVLNLFDCIVTLWFFSLFGISIESNPFGVALLQNPIVTVLFKVVVVGLALLVLYQYRDRKATQTGMNAALLVYTLIAAYHVIMTCIILGIIL